MTGRTVRERIDPSITASLFSNYRSAADAVLELVDNAIDSRRAGHPLLVELRVQAQSLLVYTIGGDGMDARDIENRYLRWGASQKRADQQLGRYGQGGKAAIGHLGQTFTIEASRPGTSVAWRFSDPEYRDRRRLKTYQVDEVVKRTPPETGYVRIRIGGVDRKIDPRVLEQRIADAYRPLIERDELRVTFGGRQLMPPALPASDRRRFSVNAAGRRIHGWYGIIDPDDPAAGWKPGLRCYSLGRLVAEGELFGHPGPAKLPAIGRLIGEVELPGVPLTMNKSDFERDSEQWTSVEARMHRELAPLVRRLETDPDPPASAAMVKVSDAVRRLLGQALRLSERPDLFLGTAPSSHAPAAPDQLPLDPVPAGGSETAVRAPAPPRVPRPPASGERGSRPGFGNVVVRALDPRVRSLTTVDGGVSTIVINSRYPLFEERRGDLLYQLETAAREIALRAEGGVAEYESRVEQIVLTAIQLRARARRPRAGRQLKLLG